MALRTIWHFMLCFMRRNFQLRKVPIIEVVTTWFFYRLTDLNRIADIRWCVSEWCWRIGEESGVGVLRRDFIELTVSDQLLVFSLLMSAMLANTDLKYSNAINHAGSLTCYLTNITRPVIYPCCKRKNETCNGL